MADDVQSLRESTGPGFLVASGSDPIDVAEAFVTDAMHGKPWETRGEDTSDRCWVERGTTAGGDWQRFIDEPVSYLSACKIETLLEVIRGEA